MLIFLDYSYGGGDRGYNSFGYYTSLDTGINFIQAQGPLSDPFLTH
jgi:hypothetical protein